MCVHIRTHSIALRCEWDRSLTLRLAWTNSHVTSTPNSPLRCTTSSHKPFTHPSWGTHLRLSPRLSTGKPCRHATGTMRATNDQTACFDSSYSHHPLGRMVTMDLSTFLPFTCQARIRPCTTPCTWHSPAYLTSFSCTPQCTYHLSSLAPSSLTPICLHPC